MKLTKLELAVLKAIDKSEYGDRLTDDIWSFSIADNIEDGVAKRSIPGVVSSLKKKGLVYCNGGDAPISRGLPNDASVGMTEAGADAYEAAVGKANVKKWRTEADLKPRPKLACGCEPDGENCRDHGGPE